MEPLETNMQSPYRLAPKRQLAVDGVRHRPPEFSHRPTATPSPTATQTPGSRIPARVTPQRPFELSDGKRAGRGFWDRFQMPVIIFGGMIAGFLVQSLWFGLAAIAIYGLLVVVFRIHSQISFALAFISLLTVPVLLLFKSNVELASNFATYTFLLLVIGVIALSFEARPKEKVRKRRKGR